MTTNRQRLSTKQQSPCEEARCQDRDRLAQGKFQVAQEKTRRKPDNHDDETEAVSTAHAHPQDTTIVTTPQNNEDTTITQPDLSNPTTYAIAPKNFKTAVRGNALKRSKIDTLTVENQDLLKNSQMQEENARLIEENARLRQNMENGSFNDDSYADAAGLEDCGIWQMWSEERT